MGLRQSKIKERTPLGCVLKHWKLFKRNSMTKMKMRVLCNMDWPLQTLDSPYKWPENGTLDYGTILSLYQLCEREDKREDLLYVNAFMSLYDRKDIQKKCKIIVPLLESKAPKKPPPGNPSNPWEEAVFRGPACSPLPPPPGPPPAPQRSPPPDNLAAGEADSEVAPPLDLRAPPPGEERGGDQMPAEQPAGTSQPPHSMLGDSALVSSSLDRGENEMLLRRDDPVRTHDFTQGPDGDTSVGPTLSPGEERIVLGKAQEEKADLPTEAQGFPPGNPLWDPNPPKGQMMLKTPPDSRPTGLKEEAPKESNFSHVSEISQGPEENPREFLERLYRAFQQSTDLSPEAWKNEELVKFFFVMQSAPDIKKQLLKVSVAAPMDISQLVDVAFKVFTKRGKVLEKRKSRREDQWLAEVLAQSFQQGNQDAGAPRRLRIDQCAYCRQYGHWKRECPRNRRRERAREALGARAGWGEEPPIRRNAGETERDSLLGAGATCSPKTPLGGKWSNEKILPHPEPDKGAEFLPERDLCKLNLPVPRENPAEEEGEEIPQRVMDAVESCVWAGGQPGRAKNVAPVQVPLKAGAAPPKVRARPLTLEERKALAPTVEKLKQEGLLKECQSAFSSPVVPFKMPNGDVSLALDLKEVNKLVADIHPKVVPDPYTLLSNVPANGQFFSVLTLKDAFSCIPLSPGSQEIFAFEWEDPESGAKTQLTWTVLPPGFKNSAAIFCSALANDLSSWDSPEGCTLLTNVAHILLCTPTYGQCEEATIALLNFLGQAGYKVDREEAQLCKREVKYLGCLISRGQRAILPERKAAIRQTPSPTTRKQLRAFLGAAEFCRLWVPNFGLMAKSLYEATKGNEREPFRWTEQCEKAFEKIKHELEQAPPLSLPDLTKPFDLFVIEKQGIALGVLTQTRGRRIRPVAYFSTRLDRTVSKCPEGVRGVAAAYEVAKRAGKLTFGQLTTLFVPHEVLIILEGMAPNQLTARRLSQYRSLLLNNPALIVRTITALDPETLLPLPGKKTQDRSEAPEQLFVSRLGGGFEPLDKADPTLVHREPLRPARDSRAEISQDSWPPAGPWEEVERRRGRKD